MEILAALPENCRSIAEVQVESWRAAYAGLLDAAFLSGLSVDRREASWREVLAEGKSELLIAVEGGTVIGFSSFGPSRDPDAPPDRGELWALYVRPDKWAIGAGRALWESTRERLRSKGFSSVSLWVFEGNAPAIRFYSKVGFVAEPGSEKEFELGGNKVRELRMVHAAEQEQQPLLSLQGSCHCGAVRLTLPSAPEKATSCNCSLCRRSGAVFGYYEFGTVSVQGHPENTEEYIWGDRTLRNVRCRKCGIITHWEPLDAKPGARHGVNLRNFDPRLLESVVVRRFDGAQTWTFLD